MAEFVFGTGHAPGLSPQSPQAHPKTRRPDLLSPGSYKDKLALILGSQEEAEASLNVKLDYCVALTTTRMSLLQFKTLYKANLPLLGKVLGKPIPKDDTGEVAQIHAHVPGLTEMLPTPDMLIVNKYIQSKSDLAIAQHPRASEPIKKMKDHYKKNLEKIHKNYIEQANIISMYPKFYMFSQKADAEAPLPGQICKIEYFSNDNKDRTRPVPTKAVGILKKVTDYYIIFDEGLGTV